MHAEPDGDTTIARALETYRNARRTTLNAVGKKVLNREFKPHYNWSQASDEDGRLVHAQEVRYVQTKAGRSIYDCRSKRLTPEEIAQREAFRADMQRQMEEVITISTT